MKTIATKTKAQQSIGLLNRQIFCFQHTHSILYALLIFAFFSTPGYSRIITVSTASAFKTAIAAIAPGDTIDVQSGTYDLNAYINVAVPGTPELPILIRSKIRGGAVLINKSFFDLKNTAYITIEGFTFNSTDGTAVKIESCNHVRITRNHFALKETVGSAWIIIQDLYNATAPASGNNRIDHNLFENKNLSGNMVRIDGFQGTPTQPSQHDRIDHNHFRNVGPRIANELETVRIGVSSLSGKSSFTVVEYNLFEDCDGDPEFVSIKTDEDTVRFNTFRSCMGTLCFRQTSRSVAYGNFFLGNGKDSTGGVRVYKTDNKVYNNYFENLTSTRWDAALTITNGDVDTGSTSQSSHGRPLRTVFAFNTLVNNLHNIEIGFTNNDNYGKSVVNPIIANNIIVGSKNNLVTYFTAPLNPVYTGNIFFPKESAVLGITATEAQISTADPKLEFRDSIWRLSASSPAIDAAQGTFGYIQYDINGSLRGLAKDIGADEFSLNKPANLPLSANDVGPNANDFVSAIEEKTAPLHLESKGFALQQNYPNPFNPSTTISYQTSMSGLVTLKVYNALGKEVATLVNENKPAGSWSVNFNVSHLSSGVYFYRLTAGYVSMSRKMTILK